MPIIAIPTKAVEKLAELDAKAETTGDTWDVAFRHGFIEGLRATVPDIVGFIIMEADSLRAGEPGLPRLCLKPLMDGDGK